MERRNPNQKPGSHGRKPSKGKRWLVRLAVVILILVAAQIIHQIFQDEEKAIRTGIRQFLSGQFPEITAQIKANYGIRPYLGQETGPGRNDRKSNIVLVHGLDDPGRVWMNLAPRLAREGYRVWILSYPNDQPIVESARFFLNELALLRKKGIVAVDVVAHSMGGLVTREMLTNPDFGFPEEAAAHHAPVIKHFIMVGTPNHGSQMARFRALSEMRDQLVLLWNHQHHWLQSVADGAGEAGLDLLPGSRFLEELNQRPLPEDVNLLVIAGMITSWQIHDLEAKIESARARSSENENHILNQLSGHLQAMADGIGDGLVTVDSARLPGVSLRIVPGTHLSIIRNLTEDNPREPPAIPIILKQLSTSNPAAGRF